MLTLSFDNAIYNISAVKKAIKDYQGLADFSVKTKNDSIVVDIKNIRNKELMPVFSQ